MTAAGLWMLVAVAPLMVVTGLPAYLILIGVAGGFAVYGVAAGLIPVSLLFALPSRLSGLLDNDLLQALPLYVLMGVLLHRLPLAEILFRTGRAVFAGNRAAPLLSAIGMGALLAPMNGSVGASVATLSHVVQPRLRAAWVPQARGLAVVCVASTLGVVVPPSLVLILLGDAMMRAHTEAVNMTGVAARIVNTQDLFRGALVPAALFIVLSAALIWWSGRGGRDEGRGEAVPLADRATAALTLAFIVGLLGAVAAGVIYAVEAAATGAFALAVFGIAIRKLRADMAGEILNATMAITGALFALFIAAATFSLVLRAFETDRLVAALLDWMPGGAAGATGAVLGLLALCALVLDAFEITFVVIPVVMPPLLAQVPDPVWVSVLTLLVLQASFLVPPFGYAVMMARCSSVEPVPIRPLAAALAPFLAGQVLVFALTVAFPGVTHLFDEPAAAKQGGIEQPLGDEEMQKRFRDALPPLDD